jgi:NADH dehydrogenase FAD-containing subunit
LTRNASPLPTNGTFLGRDFTLPQDAPAEITLVDRNHFHLFTPLLHEVVSGVIHPGLIMTPIRRILRGKRINFLRARVDAMPEVPSVYVLGDAAHARHPETGEVYPPTAQVAYRQAVVATANIAADTQGGSRQAFDFTYIGDLVSLGRLSGVADPFGIKLRGTFAWAMWKLYYLLNLVGWQNRLRVALNWLLALLFPTNSALSYECTPECAEEICL